MYKWSHIRVQRVSIRLLQVTKSVLGIVNNLILVNENDLAEVDSGTSVTAALEQQISHVQKNPSNFTSIQENIGVEAVKFESNISKAITFVNLLAGDESKTKNCLNEDLSEERIRMYNNDTNVTIINSVTSISIPPKIIEMAVEGNSELLSQLYVQWRY